MRYYSLYMQKYHAMCNVEHSLPKLYVHLTIGIVAGYLPIACIPSMNHTHSFTYQDFYQ